MSYDAARDKNPNVDDRSFLETQQTSSEKKNKEEITEKRFKVTIGSAIYTATIGVRGSIEGREKEIAELVKKTLQSGEFEKLAKTGNEKTKVRITAYGEGPAKQGTTTTKNKRASLASPEQKFAKTTNQVFNTFYNACKSQGGSLAYLEIKQGVPQKPKDPEVAATKQTEFEKTKNGPLVDFKIAALFNSDSETSDKITKEDYDKGIRHLEGLKEMGFSTITLDGEPIPIVVVISRIKANSNEAFPPSQYDSIPHIYAHGDLILGEEPIYESLQLSDPSNEYGQLELREPGTEYTDFPTEGTDNRHFPDVDIRNAIKSDAIRAKDNFPPKPTRPPPQLPRITPQMIQHPQRFAEVFKNEVSKKLEQKKPTLESLMEARVSLKDLRELNSKTDSETVKNHLKEAETQFSEAAGKYAKRKLKRALKNLNNPSKLSKKESKKSMDLLTELTEAGIEKLTIGDEDYKTAELAQKIISENKYEKSESLNERIKKYQNIESKKRLKSFRESTFLDNLTTIPEVNTARIEDSKKNTLNDVLNEVYKTEKEFGRRVSMLTEKSWGPEDTKEEMTFFQRLHHEELITDEELNYLESDWSQLEKSTSEMTSRLEDLSKKEKSLDNKMKAFIKAFTPPTLLNHFSNLAARISRHKESDEILRRVSKNKKGEELFKKFSNKNSLSPSDVIVTAVQRGPRYPLLMREVEKNSENINEEAKKAMQTNSENTTKLVSSANEMLQ